MHFGDYTFILILALILFGPKKLPELARQAGRLMMEFRRASNEFKMQMDEELRNLEEEDRRKKLEEAAADTGTIAEPHALPTETTQAETLSEAEADDELHKPQPYTPPLPDEECIDPVDLLDAPQTHPEDLYAEDSDHGEEDHGEESDHGEDRYSPYRGYVEPQDDSEDHGPEISAASAESADPASYQPSDEPHTPAQAESETPTHEASQKSQDPVRPESDPAIRHA